MSIDFLISPDTWFWGILFTGCIISVCVVYKMWFIRQLRIPILIRIFLFLLLIFILQHPKITQQTKEENSLEWNLYTDNSLSMGYHHVNSLTTLNEGINSVINNLENKGIQLKQYHFSREIFQTELYEHLDASGSSTDIGIVLQSIKDKQDDKLAGAIIITDGQITQGFDPVQLSKEIHVPIQIIGIGENTPFIDLAIKSIDVPTVAIKDEDIDAKVTIVSTGISEEKKVNITLMSNKEIIGSKFLQLSGDGVQINVHFRFNPKKLGNNIFQVQISSMEDEINIQNNRQTFNITILKNKYNVAMITGVPNFNTTWIKKILSAEPRINMNHFVYTQDSFKPSIKSFWETPYDLIVLDNYPTHHISSQWQRLFAKKIIAQKSALSWIAGPEIKLSSAKVFFPFFHLNSEKSISIDNNHYPWSLSENINNFPFALSTSSNSGSIDESEFPPLKPGMIVSTNSKNIQSIAHLNSVPEIPVLFIGEEESLRSSVWTTPDLYSLYYKLTDTMKSEIFLEFWKDIFEWLMRAKGDNDMFFRLDKEFYQQGELIKVMGSKFGQLSPDSKVAITIHQGDETINSTELRYNPTAQRWEGQLWASKPGNYNYEIHFQNDNSVSSQIGSLIVNESQIELNKVFLNERLLKKIAATTNGNYFNWNSRSELIDYIDPKTVVKQKFTQIELRNEWWILIGILIFLTFEWSMKRRAGLV